MYGWLRWLCAIPLAAIPLVATVIGWFLILLGNEMNTTGTDVNPVVIVAIGVVVALVLPLSLWLPRWINLTTPASTFFLTLRGLP